MTASVDVGPVDWLAVEFVCNGTPMRLGDDPATLRAAILRIGYGLTPQQIAERLGTNTRRVSRTLEKAGALICPYCQRYAMCDDGVLPWHVKKDETRCEMSGHRADDLDWAQKIRLAQKTVTALG